MSDRLPFPRAELRRRTVRGAMVTAGFLVGIDLLVLIQGLVVTRLLGPSQIGLYGVVSTTVISLIALKRVGIDEAFVQQEEADQEREFQHAFTLELVLSAGMALVILALSPVVALVYRDDQLLPLMASLAYLPLAFALQAPLWIFFRRMDYRRQRSLQAIQPLVSFVVTIPLAAATDLGVWSIIIGQVAGYVVAVAATVAVSPYRLRLRFDRTLTARYLGFSAPILLTVVATMVVAQGQILVFKLHDGLAAAGYITLAATLTRYIDRADQIITATIYPAICAIQNQREALEELYLKSNRATLMWVLPYAAGIVLFAPDLVSFVLGDQWAAGGGAAAGARDRRCDHAAGLQLVLVLPRARPDPAARGRGARRAWRRSSCWPSRVCCSTGSTGSCTGGLGRRWWRWRCAACTCAGLLGGVRYRALLTPTLLPLALGVRRGAALRLVLWGGRRTLAQALAELVLFVGVYAVTAVPPRAPASGRAAGGAAGTA